MLPVRRLCSVLGVPAVGIMRGKRSSNGWWGRQCRPGKRRWSKPLASINAATAPTGLQVALREKWHRVGRQRLCTALARQGLRALQPKVFTQCTTNSPHELRCTPNLLLDQPTPTQTHRVWVSGITYLPLANSEWAYRYVFQDRCTKHVMG